MSDETLQNVHDVKMAVKSAYQYIQSMQDLMGRKLDELRLEEVELSEDKNAWLITLGYDVPVIQRKTALEEIMVVNPLKEPHKFQREYKLFTVNASTGVVESMKIRRV
ncbi:MAG: hypothetical protein AAF215_20670 [Cyanobacteria bacterium P01_A01_bin.123]